MTEEIANGESDRLEFKRGLTKDDSKWLKTVVAFANGRGGRILFGVDSDRSIVGMGEDIFGAKDAIADAMANGVRPLPPVTIGVTTLAGKSIIVLEVGQGMQCPYYLRSKGDTDGVYVRYDATTRLADENILKELRLDGAGRSFDQTEARGLSVTERDIEKLCTAMRRTAKRNAKTDEQRKGVKPVTKAQLVKWGILIERGGELLPTWAFVLLSGNARLSPHVKCGIFKGTDRTFFVDRREFDSPVQDQVESAVQYVLEKINMGARFHGAYREDVYEIPPDSIREIIVNAIVHRSYVNAEASPVTVALYDDRLEVTSPGGLPRGMTLAKMLAGYSECRNKALASAFAYMNLIENWGSGVKRYVTEIKAAGLREPEFIEWPNAMRVNIYRSKATPQVSTHAVSHAVAAHAVTNTVGDTVTTQDIAQVTAQDIAQVTAQVKTLLHVLVAAEEDVSSIQLKIGVRQRRDFMRRYITPALSAGLIERTIPDKPTSRFQKYRLTDKGRAALAGSAHHI